MQTAGEKLTEYQFVIILLDNRCIIIVLALVEANY